MQSYAELQSISEQWAAFLNQDCWAWSLYCHLTFRDIENIQDKQLRHVHPEQAHKIWMLFLHKLNRSIFGVRYTRRPGDGVTWARATELQNRGAIHYHAIIGRVPVHIKRLALMDEWNEKAGFARIFQYEAGKGAEGYLSKSAYAWKRGEIDLGGPLAYLQKHEDEARPRFIA